MSCRISKVKFKDGRELRIIAPYKPSTAHNMFKAALTLLDRAENVTSAGFFIMSDKGCDYGFDFEKGQIDGCIGGADRLKHNIQRHWDDPR